MKTPQAGSPVRRRLVLACNILLVCSFLALVFLLGCFKQRDMDIWWHLKTGQLILERGQVPRHDWYTFTCADRPWIDLHWLFQIGAALIYKRGGMELLTLASATLATVAVGILLLARRTEYRLPLQVLCLLPALLLMSGRFYVRPEIVTLVLLAATLTILFQAAQRPRLAFLLPPILLLWVNVQGLFVLGLVCLSCWCLDQLLRRMATRRAVPLKHLGFLLGASLVACLVNPYGYRALVFPFELYRKMSSESAFFGTKISELLDIWSFIETFGFKQLYLQAHLFLLVLGALSFPLAWVKWRFDLFRLLLFAAFGYLSLQATRNSSQFALVAGAVLSWNVCDCLAVRSGVVEKLRVALLARGLMLAIIWSLGIAVWSGRFYELAGEGRLVGLGEHPYWHAHAAARLAAKPGMPGRMLAYHLGQAALFEFYMRPDQRVFCDPRLEVITKEVLEEHDYLARAIAEGRPGWEAWLRAMQVEMILVNSRSALEAALIAAASWHCVHFGPVAGLYLEESAMRRAGLEPVDWLAWHMGVGLEAAAAGNGASSAARAAQAGERYPRGPVRNIAWAKRLAYVSGSYLERFRQGRVAQLLLLCAVDHAQLARFRWPGWVEPWRWLGWSWKYQAEIEAGIDAQRPPWQCPEPHLVHWARVRLAAEQLLASGRYPQTGWSLLVAASKRQGDKRSHRRAQAVTLELYRKEPLLRKLLGPIPHWPSSVPGTSETELALARLRRELAVVPANLEELDRMTWKATEAGD